MDTAERLEYLSSFVLAFSDLVEVRSSSEKGFGLHSSKACAEGCVLLRVPFSSCITREDADIQELDPQALLRLSTLRTMQQPEDPRAVYLCMAAPLASFTSHPAAWPASLASSCCSLAARCSRGWREALEMEWRQWKERQVIPPDTSEKDHFWSALLVQTRALDTELKGLLLCPGVDLCNHVSVAPTAKVQVKDGHMTLVASYAMEPGDEVSISYYPEADYLDLFEAYGFFDSSCQIHTVEVPLSLATLQDKVSTAQLAAIRGYAKGGYAEDLEAWWVPDFNVEACPLWLAVRACFADEEELGERLGDPIRREKEVKAFLRQIFQTHLDTYGSVEGTEATNFAGAAPAAAISAARELVKFETTLLRSYPQSLRS